MGNGEQDKMVRELEKHGYLLQFLLGEGATCGVSCVKDMKSGKNYACKAGSRKDLLAAEYDLLNGQKHPLFPEAVEFWLGEEQGFLVMEYLGGNSLECCLKRRQRFSPREAARFAMELADGLDSMHRGARPAVYRDLKPANIMIQQDGRSRVMDLGAACRLETGKSSSICRAGTPGFSAPEQFERGAEPDARQDVYALGKVLLCMLGVCDPASGQEQAGIQVCPPGALRILAEDCLQRDPVCRIPDMREVIRRLGRLSGSSQGGIFRNSNVLFLGKSRKEGLRYEKNVIKSCGPCPGPFHVDS